MKRMNSMEDQYTFEIINKGIYFEGELFSQELSDEEKRQRILRNEVERRSNKSDRQAGQETS